MSETITSRDFARFFKKPHFTVLERIRKLLPDLPEEHQRNFQPITLERLQPYGGTRKHPGYSLSHEGFILLAMLMGKEALPFKISYVFHKTDLSESLWTSL